MSATPAAPTESKTSTEAESFLTRLVGFGDSIIAAERPTAADVPKVLGALIHWIDQEGAYETPATFNPGVSEQLAEQEAQQNRLAEENASLQKRMESLETLMREQLVATQTPAAQPPAAAPIPASPLPPVPVGSDTSGEVAAPAAAAPAPVVPGVPAAAPETVQAPPEAAPAPAAAPPVSD